MLTITVPGTRSGPVFSYKSRYIVGFWLVEMAISTNQKPTIYRNLYENTAPGPVVYDIIIVGFGLVEMAILHENMGPGSGVMKG